jgi:hypothetical protein
LRCSFRSTFAAQKGRFSQFACIEFALFNFIEEQNVRGRFKAKIFGARLSHHIRQVSVNQVAKIQIYPQAG